MRTRVPGYLPLLATLLPFTQFGACSTVRDYAEGSAGEQERGSAGDDSMPQVSGGEAGAFVTPTGAGGASPGAGGTTSIPASSGGTLGSNQGGKSSGGLPSSGGVNSAGGSTAQVSCPPPPSPAEGSVRVSGTGVGAQATYECGVGHSLSGVATRICQANGTWSGTIPTCPLLNCDPPMLGPHASFSASCTAYGCAGKFSCEAGYAFNAEAARTCGKDGTWGTTPECISCRLQPESDTLALWELEDGTGQTFRDSGPNKLNGTLGATTSAETADPTWTTEGRFGAGLNFERANSQFLRVNKGVALGTNQFTVELWVRPKTGISEVFSSNAVTLTLEVPSRVKWQIHDGTQWISYSAEDNLTADSWHHIAITYDGENIAAYRDGSQIYLPKILRVTLPVPTEFYLGGQVAFFDGTLGPVRISSTAHSQPKIYEYGRLRDCAP